MKNYALIGRHLGHSFSQRWFETLFAQLGLSGYTYRLAEMPDLDGLRQWVADNRISGFNVTVPYKQSVMSLLDAVDATAAAVGAVNCVTVEDGRLVGHNTDCQAFRETFREALPVPHTALQGEVLVLGTGGAARAVAYALGELGIKYLFVSRHPDQHRNAISYDEAADRLQAQEATVIVNATPVGMFPDSETSPWPRTDLLANAVLVYDLVYNPSPTLLMRQAAASGVPAVDGLAMLHRQTELSWQHFQNAR